MKKIKVDKSVKPIPLSEREIFDIQLGGEYYMSLGRNIVTTCIVEEIYFEGNRKRLLVEVEDGQRTLFADEIGRTPEEAVMNSIS